jgi:hypothetical protein
MASSDRAAAVAFVAKLLREDAEISFSEMKKRAKPEGHHLYPLIVGLARKENGMQPSAKAKAAKKPGRKPGRPAASASAAAPLAAAPVKRGPGRPRKVALAPAGDASAAIAALESQFALMREALRAIADVASRF